MELLIKVNIFKERSKVMENSAGQIIAITKEILMTTILKAKVG
jgi:hypothetical protein